MAMVAYSRALPTLDTIAERLSAEAASGHIDARIVDAAHLLADKTYGDEVDPSELTPRERRRLSAPSSPCANTAAACWSSMQEKKPRTTTASSRYSLGEAASRFEGSERDVVSETGPLGNCVPEWARDCGRFPGPAKSRPSPATTGSRPASRHRARRLPARS